MKISVGVMAIIGWLKAMFNPTISEIINDKNCFIL